MDWLEIVKAIGSPLGSTITVVGGAVFAIHRAKQAILETRDQDEDRRDVEQRAVIHALRGELSANIYLVMDRLERREGTKVVMSLRTRIYDANASRISQITSRSYAWLSVLYGRIDALEASGRLSEEPDLLKPHLGHAVLMRAAMERLTKGLSIRNLSDLPEAEFRTSIARHTSHEQQLLIDAKAIWAQSVIESGRT